MIPRLFQLLNSLKRRLRNLVKPNNYALSAHALTDLTRSKSELMLENAFLRQQLIILERQVKRPRAKPRERVLLVATASRLKNWKQALLIVQPATVVRWHQDLYTWMWRIISKPPSPGSVRRRWRQAGPKAGPVALSTPSGGLTSCLTPLRRLT